MYRDISNDIVVPQRGDLFNMNSEAVPDKQHIRKRSIVEVFIYIYQIHSI